MAPSSPATAHVASDESMTPPCNLHDDRLRAIEIEQAQVGQTLNSLEASLGRLERGIEKLSESIEKVDGRVERLGEQVGEIRIEQVSQGKDIASLQKDEEKVEKKSEHYRELFIKFSPFLATLVFGWLAGARGRELLASLVRSLG